MNVELPIGVLCSFCGWRPEDPTIFRFVSQPCCIKCGSPMAVEFTPRRAIESNARPPTAWRRVLDDPLGEDD